MKTSIINIPLRVRSAADDYSCPDGELDNYMNIYPAVSGVRTSTDPVSAFTMRCPPPPKVEFSLLRSVLPGWTASPLSLPGATIECDDGSEKGWREKALQVLADFYEDADNAGLFTSPFLVMTAFRLKDGHHISPTPPVLMIPNSKAPFITTPGIPADEAVRMSVTAAVCKLQWRVTFHEDTPEWAGEISTLDVFVSPPVPLHDSRKSLALFHRRSFSGFTHSQSPDGLAGEMPVSEETFSRGWCFPEMSDVALHNFISGIESFNMISSLPFSAFAASEGDSEFMDIDLNCGATPHVPVAEPYRPDFLHLSGIDAAGAVEFSGRTTIFDITVTPPSPLPLSSHAPFCNIAGYIPRFIFHPCRESRVYTFSQNGASFSLPLSPHPSLHGAFMLRSLGASAPSSAVSSAVSALQPTRLPNAVWRSETDHSPLFPDSLFLSLSPARVISLQRAFRSSGLVATTAPTVYLFSSEGIFLLREMADGTFRDAGLISDDILANGDSIRRKGSSLYFLSADGLEMVISGTSVKPAASAESDLLLSWRAGEGEFSFCTRALKLGSPEEIRLLRSVTLRGNFDAGEVTLELEGSHNLRVWHPVAAGRRASVATLWGIAYPYLRVKVSGAAGEGDSFSALVVRVVRKSRRG